MTSPALTPGRQEEAVPTRSMPPKISVCVTTYNRAAALPKTLDSILRQTRKDFELIVSDDCSTDETPAVMGEYAARDSRVRYRRNAANLKMPGNLNAAISWARGEYIANLHDGDFYREDLLERWEAALDRYSTAAFVFCDSESFALDGSSRIFTTDMPPCMNGREFARRYLFHRWGCPVWGTVMARRACYLDVGQFDDRFGHISDIDMWMRLSMKYDVAFVGEPLIKITNEHTEYRRVRWQWFTQIADIHQTNVQRYYHRRSPARYQNLLRFWLRRDRLFIWGLLWCVKYRRWDMMREGVHVLRKTNSPALRVVAAIGRLAAPGMSRRVGDREALPR